jgi:hypothetical protein
MFIIYIIIIIHRELFDSYAVPFYELNIISYKEIHDLLEVGDNPHGCS